jgi:ABC-2 type transport system permease protein
VFIYLRYNLEALKAIGGSLARMPAVDSFFFMSILSWQSFAFGGMLALVIGPGLVSADLVNNALPLYLSRPLSRRHYVLGKLAALALPLSAMTWAPGLLLFGLQAALAEKGWGRAHAHLPLAIIAGSLLWILVLSLMALAASALTRRKVTAQSLLVGVVMGGAWIGAAVNGVFQTDWGSVLNLGELMRSLQQGLYRVPLEAPLPVVAPLLILPVLCGACLLILARRLKAKEVVR